MAEESVDPAGLPDLEAFTVRTAYRRLDGSTAHGFLHPTPERPGYSHGEDADTHRFIQARFSEEHGWLEVAFHDRHALR